MTNQTSIIQDVLSQEAQYQKNKTPVVVNRYDCCATLSEAKTVYDVYIPEEILPPSSEQVIDDWISLIMNAGFPVEMPRKNNLVETTIRNKIKYYNCDTFQRVMQDLKERINGKKSLKSAGEEIFIKGTKRGGKVYRWTAENLRKAKIIDVDLSEGVAHIAAEEHDDESITKGEVFKVVLYYFDYMDGTPVMDMQVLEEELNNYIIKYVPGYLIRIDPRGKSSMIKLATLTLVRYLWIDSYKNLIPDFYEIKESVSEGTFFEILLLASAKNGYNGGRAIFDFGGIGERGDDGEFPYFKSEKEIWKDLSSGEMNINSSFWGKPIKEYLSFQNFRNDLLAKKYRKAYGDMLYASYGKKGKDAQVVKAIENHGFITKDKQYLVRDENEQSYKVVSDDYSAKWYKKDRFVTV